MVVEEGWAVKYRNNEVEQIQQAPLLYLAAFRFLRLFSIFAIIPYLNEHHSFPSRNGARVIHHRQDTSRGVRTRQWQGDVDGGRAIRSAYRWRADSECLGQGSAIVLRENGRGGLSSSH